jgi:hypothetical protein
MGPGRIYNYFASRVFDLTYRIGPKFSLGKNFSLFVLNYVDPYFYMEKWFTQPFNGQIARHKQILQIADFLRPTVAIETGTFLGTTTPYLASMCSGRTYTIEFVPKYAAKAQMRFENEFKGMKIQLIQGNSAQELEKILTGIDPSSAVLSYLDAHWERELPTAQELEHLLSWGPNWVAVIDDFKVPGDDSYGFDQYGDLVVDSSLIPTGVRLFVPAKSAEYETGARKGTAYVFGPAYASEDFTERFTNLREIR